MKKTTSIGLLFCMLVLSLLSACGGGSSNTSYQPTSAILTLSTAITNTLTFPTATTIDSYVVTVTLPAGVTVRTMPSSSATSTGVVVPSGKALGAFIDGVYTAASGSVPGNVRIYVAGTGFEAGEFCIVKGDITPGYYPTASSFVTPSLDDAFGTDNSDPLKPSSVVLTGELTLSAKAVVQ